MTSGGLAKLSMRQRAIFRGLVWGCFGAAYLASLTFAQDRVATTFDKIAAGTPKEGVQQTWTPDFHWYWPDDEEGFRDLFIAQGTDALALGYYLDVRSISPKGFYGVIVPRFGGAMGGRNFLVELDKRRIVGVLEGSGFAFPARSKVSWSYHWAPGGEALAIEQASQGEKSWEREQWNLVELRDDQIVKQTNLLEDARKVPAWLDASRPVGEERSFPIPPKVPLVLAESSNEDGCWKVERDVAGGPLHMVLHDKRVGPLPPVRAMMEGPDGKVAEASSDEIPGLPLCFFSPDQEWLFVNQIVKEDPGTGVLTRIGAIYRRNEGANGAAATWELATEARADELAWRKFSELEKIPAEDIAPPDAAGWRDRTMEFIVWGQDSGRVLVELSARQAGPVGAKGHAARYRWFCYFNTRTLAFETHRSLDLANDELRKRWNVGDGSLRENLLPLRAARLGTTGLFAPPSELEKSADRSLNLAYTALIQRTNPLQVDRVRGEQRNWLKYRDTLAWVHVAQRWTRFPEAVLDEGRFLATHVRAAELREGAIKQRLGPNTVIRDKSPDGKFGVLYTYAGDDLDEHGPLEGMELLELATKRVLMDFYDETTNRALKVIWAPDSRHFAFHCSSRRVGGFTIYARRGDGFTALKSPDFDRFEPKTREGDQAGHFNGSDEEPKRWLGPKRLLIDYSMNFDVEKANGGASQAEAYYDIVLVIDGNEKISIEKATKKKAPE